MTRLEYLTLRDLAEDDSLRPAFDKTVAGILDGTARVRTFQSTSAKGFTGGGRDILGTAVLEYALTAPATEFDAASAKAFTEKVRALLGWNTISYTLKQWVQRRLRDGWFTNAGPTWVKKWVRVEGTDPSSVPPGFFEFACYVAIGELKYGPSYASVAAEEILGWVTALGSDLPARLKRHGTGDLPPELVRFSAAGATASANDALAVVKLRISEETSAAYVVALHHLAQLLETTDFPRSYAIEFRGPTKTYLPIKGLPKKGVHQLFAAASAYPEAWPAIERYARAAMHEYEWYTNLDDEHCAMPGTFAVFALGLADPTYAGLVVEYLKLTDGEHQSLQAKFVEAYVDAHGFTAEAVAYLVACAGNIRDDGRLIAKAPADLRPLYEEILTKEKP